MTKTTQRNKPSSFDKGFLKVLLIAFLIGLLSFLLCLSAFSLILMKYNLSFNKTPYMLIISCIVSGLIAGFSLSRKLKIKGLLAGILAALPLMLVEILTVTILSSANVASGVYMIIPLVLISGGIGGILAVNIKPKRRIK